MKYKKTIDHDAKIREFCEELIVLRELISLFEFHDPRCKLGRQKRRIRTLKMKIAEEYARKNRLRGVHLRDVVGIWSSSVCEDVDKSGFDNDSF